jgi:hypothetical protein
MTYRDNSIPFSLSHLHVTEHIRPFWPLKVKLGIMLINVMVEQWGYLVTVMQHSLSFHHAWSGVATSHCKSAAVIRGSDIIFPCDSVLCSIRIVLDMVKFTLQHQAFLYGYYVKYKSARTCQRKFRVKFRGIRIPQRNSIQNVVNKVRTGMSVNTKLKHCWVLTEEKFIDIRAAWTFALYAYYVPCTKNRNIQIECGNCCRSVETTVSQDHRHALFASAWSSIQTISVTGNFSQCQFMRSNFIQSWHSFRQGLVLFEWMYEHTK